MSVEDDYSIRDSYMLPHRAASYDARHARTAGQRFRIATELRLLQRLLARLAPAGGRLLEVPCGTGRVAAALTERGWRLTGLDLSPAMVGFARARPGLAGTGFAALQGEVERLPFADGAFDLALSVRLLRHLPEPLRWDAVAELARVGRGGALFDLLVRQGAIAWVKRLREGPRYVRRRPALGDVRAALAARGLRIAGSWSPRPWTQQRFFHVVPAQTDPSQT